ncbi:MAG TPA: prephenate dehydrogenase [Kiritimatiellia bacterium]|nr:prephenate dehydrogenase [Kiritimatiellia bacterium]
MRRVAVIGLGLMGGSIGLAIKARKLPWEVVGSTRTPARGRLALRRGAIDRLCRDPADAVAGADLVVFCAPVQTIPRLVRESARGFAPGAVVTDVASTRCMLDAEIPPLLAGTGAIFVGSHPVAGSEQQGIDAARADLYEGAMVLVTPKAGVPPRALNRVRTFWRSLGGRCRTMDSREHDRLLARTSHLPHMVASLLALTVGRTAGREQLADYCGTGFADTSRVAEGSPEVWLDIVRTNRSNLAEELRAYRIQLDRLLALLDEGDFAGIEAVLENGRSARRQLLMSRKRNKV